jgi:hypothetical protein
VRFPSAVAIGCAAMRLDATRQFLPGALLIDAEEILRLLRALSKKRPRKNPGKSCHALR